MLHLASQSSIRLHLLRQAGVDTIAVKSAFVEDHTKNQDIPTTALPLHLATEKAKAAMSMPGNVLVLGCDQILVIDNRIQHKPQSPDEARDQLRNLRGKTHQLITAAVLLRNGTIVSEMQDTATITLRPYSDEFIESYATSIAPHILMSVGCYQLEGRGAQLIERIDGDYFTILGLPLLQVLAALRRCGELPS